MLQLRLQATEEWQGSHCRACRGARCFHFSQRPPTTTLQAPWQPPEHELLTRPRNTAPHQQRDRAFCWLVWIVSLGDLGWMMQRAALVVVWLTQTHFGQQGLLLSMFNALIQVTTFSRIVTSS